MPDRGLGRGEGCGEAVDWCRIGDSAWGGLFSLAAFMLMWFLAARNALKRKKQHEHSLEQTNGQINMLEQQIYSIESANINQETLVAMKNAGAAMKQIHGKMTMEDVDVTMYVIRIYLRKQQWIFLLCLGPTISLSRAILYRLVHHSRT